MNLVERLESWRWIKPIPTKPPKREDLNKSDSKDKQKGKPFSTFASHFKEWQKEQKYSYTSAPRSSGIKFSTFSQSIAKSARKFKTEFEKIKNKDLNIFSKPKFRETEEDRIPTKVTLLYQNKSRNKQQFVRLDEDIEEVDTTDVYLVPKTSKLVTFADSTSIFSTPSNSTTSIAENHWFWLVPFHTFNPSSIGLGKIAISDGKNYTLVLNLFSVRKVLREHFTLVNGFYRYALKWSVTCMLTLRVG